MPERLEPLERFWLPERLEPLERFWLPERLEPLERLERLVDPERDGLDRLTLEFCRELRPELLPPPPPPPLRCPIK
ncbi:MAG: hypothetical protein E2P05_02195 [Acidobacteria bacterium]|nr:MAG: hypothetical protein E2P05_02195 [Acidobacteriota bacterium]